MKGLHNVCIAITMALLMLSVAQVSAVTVTVNAPEYVQKGQTFEATIDIDYIENFNAATLYISFDPNVLKVRSVEECVKDGEIGGTKIPVDTCDFIDSGEILVMLELEEADATVSGSGYLTKIEFEVVGKEDAESEINIGENSEIVTLVEEEGGHKIPEAVTTTFSGATVRVGYAIDTGPGGYPSIAGTHKGTITPHYDITIDKIYTYACEGTGGHIEYVHIWGNGIDVEASWEGYTGDWRTVKFGETFTLEADKTYNYEIRTGSYPQIIHKSKLETEYAEITCTEFTDVNGRTYYDWIPAFKLF